MIAIMNTNIESKYHRVWTAKYENVSLQKNCVFWNMIIKNSCASISWHCYNTKGRTLKLCIQTNLHRVFKLLIKSTTKHKGILSTKMMQVRCQLHCFSNKALITLLSNTYFCHAVRTWSYNRTQKAHFTALGIVNTLYNTLQKR